MDNSILNLKKCVYNAIRETEKEEKLLFFVIKSNYVITEKKG